MISIATVPASSHLIMGTLVEERVFQARVFIHNMTQKGLELSQYNAFVAIRGGGCTPIEMLFTRLHPLLEIFVSLILRNLGE